MILSVLSSLALVSGLMVVRAKNPVHSVLFFIPVFCDTSGLLLLLGLDFFAMIFPVVYIGAIAVLFLFVVMMFHIQIAEIHEEVLRYLPVSGIIGLIFWWEMFFILDNETIPLLPTQRNTTSLRYTVYAGKVRSWTNLETLGNLLYTYYSVWFLVSSLILLVAMIGAIVLANNQKVNLVWLFGFRKSLPGNGGSYDSDQRESPRLWSRAPVDLQLWLHAYFPQFGSKKVLIDNGSALNVLPP
nr:NADH dehydrogenase subunit 6 [Melia azedarach]